MKFVLASASPRRKELLSGLVEEFEIVPSRANEDIDGKIPPNELVKTLARRKAEEVASRPENEEKIVIGSDTVVAFEGNVLGKPRDREDAFAMLTALSGKRHEVYTGVCFACRKGDEWKIWTAVDETAVYFETLTSEAVTAYIDSGSPMDKAGAYGIQDGGLVKKIEGSYTNVVGFPIELVKKMLLGLKDRGFGV